MTDAEAIDLVREAAPWRGTWCDAGAGQGLFTRALARLIGPTGTVIAIDRDRRAVDALERIAAAPGRDAARVIAVRGDLREIATIPALQHTALDGVLFANSLHFDDTPGEILRATAGLMREDGHIVVIEYDRRRPNPWVPHPLPIDRLAAAARSAGLSEPREIARRPSAYHHEMYCAVIPR